MPSISRARARSSRLLVISGQEGILLRRDGRGNAYINPIVAERMNNLPKIVFSRTLNKALWNNTKLVKGDVAAEIRRMKNEPGEDMVILSYEPTA